MPASAALLDRLIGFDTQSFRSNLELVGFVRDHLAGHGVAIRLVPDDSGEKANLFAVIGPRDVPGLVLSGHTDVVPVAGQAWTGDPFLARHQDGYTKLKRNPEAVAQFLKMVEYDPDNANSYDSLGDGYMANGQLDEALKSYAKAVSIDPKFAPSVFNLAKCYEKKNMKLEAKENYKRYIALVPTGSQSDEARSKIKD